MSADLVDSWDSVEAGLQPVAPMTGPFPTAAFLEAWRSHQGASDIRTPIAVAEGAAVPLWIDRGVVRFSGEADLTDYHSPLGGSTDECLALIAARFSGCPFSLDSLPHEALESLGSALSTAGITYASRGHGATLVIDLPATLPVWPASLRKKHRHELRRKRRRFADICGEPLLERRTDPEAFAAFVTMHRSSRAAKGDFMTKEMERFFWSLVTNAGASIDLLTADGSPVAAGFGFGDTETFYLYNSSYAADTAEASPGIVLVAAMIERSIDEGLERFDFLKGDEQYKYRLGAVDRALAVLEGVFP